MNRMRGMRQSYLRDKKKLDDELDQLNSMSNIRERLSNDKEFYDRVQTEIEKCNSKEYNDMSKALITLSKLRCYQHDWCDYTTLTIPGDVDLGVVCNYLNAEIELALRIDALGGATKRSLLRNLDNFRENIDRYLRNGNKTPENGLVFLGHGSDSTIFQPKHEYTFFLKGKSVKYDERSYGRPGGHYYIFEPRTKIECRKFFHGNQFEIAEFMREIEDDRKSTAMRLLREDALKKEQDNINIISERNAEKQKIKQLEQQLERIKEQLDQIKN